MLIILEGPDLAGKSTLASSLQTHIAANFPRERVTLLHRGPPTQHPLHEYITPLLDYYPDLGQHIICDRWHLGEIVYPSVVGRPTQMTSEVRRYVEAFLKSRGALLVYVDAPDEELHARYESRGDESRSLFEVLWAADEFRRVVEAPGHELAVTRLRDVAQIVDAAMGRHVSVRQSGFKRAATYVGSPHPVTLYVGDVRGCDGVACRHDPKHDPRFPAFGPFPNTCGDFLMRCLPREFEWGLVNANDVDHANLEYALNAQHVVALGRRASKALKSLNVSHTVVPHPQWVKRFHHRDVDEYRRLLSFRDNEEHMWKS